MKKAFTMDSGPRLQNSACIRLYRMGDAQESPAIEQQELSLGLARAKELLEQAVAILDAEGAMRAALHAVWAIDTLTDTRKPAG